MAADPSIVKQAREWIDRVDAGRGLSNSWRLQIIQKRYRKRDVQSDTGTALECDGESCVGLPMRIRRFVPGCPWALVDQAIRYLVCKAPYEGLIYNGLEIPGRYRPTLTTWQRDEQSSVDEQRPQNGTYTLIQDLIEEGCEDEETVVTGESCSYVETTEYHWDDSAPGELPGCGSECDGSGVCQGVTYAIRSNRNEDGTFDWQLVKRVAKTQHAGPFDVECNGCTGKVTRETWDNLYGNAKDGFRDDCGNPVILPGCDDIPGIRTQVQIQQNSDCTFKVEVTRRENLEYSDSWTDGTACRTRDVYDGRNLREVPDGYRPAVGETVRVQLKRNDDCTYDYQREVTSAPEELEYSWTDGNECRPRTVTIIKDAKTMPAVPTVGPGETLDASIQRNQDCTWDVQFSVRKPAKEETIEWDQGSACRPQHVRSYQNSANLPEVPVPSAGQTISASIRRNDDCTYDGQVTITEQPRTSVLEWNQGSACQTEHVRSYQNSVSVPEVPTPSPGQTVSASIRRNDDCTYDGQVTVREGMKEEVLQWTQGSRCRPQHVTRTMNSASVPEVPVPEEGQTVSASISRNSDCTYDGQVTLTYPGSAEPVTYITGSQCVRVTEVAVRNAKEPLEIPVAKKGQTVQANISRQDDCTYDSRYSVTEVSPEEMSWTEGSQCKVVESHHLLNQADYSAIPSPGKGQTVSASVQRNQDCTYDVSYKVTNPYGGSDVTWDDGPACKRRHHTQWIDMPDKPEIAEAKDGETIQASISFDPSTCSWSGQQIVTDALRLDEALSWDDGPECQRSHHRLYVDSVEKPDLTQTSPGQTVRASLSFNDQNCTWNGQVTRTDPMSSDTVVTVGGTCRSAETTETVLNSPDKPDLKLSPAPGETVQARVSRNSDCTWDSTVVTRRSEMGTASWEDGTCMNRSVTYVYSDAPEGTIRTAAAGMSKSGNDTVSIRITPNQDCTESGSVTVVTHEEKTETRTWSSGRYDVEYTSYRNSKTPKIVSAYDCRDSANNSFSLNDNCLYDGHSVKMTRRDCSGSSGQFYLYGPYAKEIDYDEGRRVKGNGAKQKVYSARKKYIVHGSQLYKDIGDYLLKMTAAGFTVSGFQKIGSYSSDSAVFMAVLTGSAFDAKEPAEKRNKESNSTVGN